MTKIFPAVILVLLATIAAIAGERESAAESAAGDWLSHIDAGDYRASWSNAGAPFKKQLTAEAWQSAVSAAREPLGAVRNRTLKAAQHSTTLPGAPDGEYVVLQFDTSFENKATGVETVTTVLEGGAWRVIGYFIQ